MKFPESLQAHAKAAGRDFIFEDSDHLLEWARAELKLWAGEPKSGVAALDTVWAEQTQYFQGIVSVGEKFEKNPAQPVFDKLRNIFREPLERGTVLTSSHHASAYIVEIFKEDPTRAALLVLARYPPNKILEHLTHNTVPVLGVMLAKSLLGNEGEIGAKSVESARREIEKVQANLESLKAGIVQWFDSTKVASEGQSREQQSAFEGKAKQWEEALASVESRWEELKRFVQKDLATAAPVLYWKNRATDCRNSARIWALSFFGLLVISGMIFYAWGMPALGSQKANPSLVQLLPVVIPIFFLIWALRIVDRLLADNLSLMRDAEDRKTMIEAFLALAKEKGANQPLIRAEDQVLMLSAIFRASPLASSDDSPPVSVFEPLLKHTKK